MARLPIIAKEKRAFFVRKRYDLQGTLRLDAAFVHDLQRLDRREHPERTVEVAAVADGVEVRAGEDERSFAIPAFPAADKVASGVFAHLQARLAHVGGYQVFGGPFFLRKGEAGDASASGSPDLRQLGEPGPEAFGVDLCCGTIPHS